MFLSMLPSTEGNAVSAFTLGSQFIWSTACPRASPLTSGCCSTQRSASTTCSGNVDAERICATSESGYSAMGATICCNCSGVFVAYSGPCGSGGGAWASCADIAVCGQAANSSANDSSHPSTWLRHGAPAARLSLFTLITLPPTLNPLLDGKLHICTVVSKTA